ncbi:MAG: heterodisulfide reductase-related iron-sulfur binding cluster [Candidatus Odinarchaeota archaeon]
MFDVDECIRCGICLESCPVIDLDIDQAKEEIENLIAGSSFVVNQCAICGTCDLNCPNDLTPSHLIKELKLAKIKELEENGKIRRSSKFIFPYNKPNVYDFYEKVMMSPEEAKNLEEWKSPSKSEELVILGCAISYLMQYLYKNPTLEGLLEGKTLVGGIDFCCGEVYHRACMPLPNIDFENHLYSRFSSLGAKRLILFCNECYEAYKTEYKRISNDFEIISIWEYIVRAIETGDLKITNKLNLKVAFHDSCVVKKYPELLDYPRKIVELTGCEIIELEHNRENALCCGLSLSLLDQKLMEKIRTKRFREFKRANTEYIINTCPGCISTFAFDYRIQMKKYKVLSVLDLLRMSCGEEINLSKNVEVFNDILNTSMELYRKRKMQK